jgi:phenylpyruvate tautomerase PptA (4-oxalocrotonate tautomerase family)
MALARIEILEGRSPQERAALVNAVRAALSEGLQTPEDDPAVRLSEYPPEQFSLPYPERCSDRFTLVEVTMFAGRSMEAKRRLYDADRPATGRAGRACERRAGCAPRAADGELGRQRRHTGQRG